MSVNFTSSNDIHGDGSNTPGYEYTDPNVAGATVVYKFDSSFEMVGEAITYDNGDIFSETTVDNGDGTYTVNRTETISGGDSRAFNYTYNSTTDAFVSGTETVNGNTKTFNASWEVVSEQRDTSALGTALESSALTNVPESLLSTQADELVYSSVENFAGGSETTFYDSTGAILGYASTTSWAEGSGTYSSTIYSNPDWNFAGNSWSDGYGGSGSSSMVEKVATADNATAVGVSSGDKYFEESGTSSWTGADGGTETRNYTYRFEFDNGNLGNFLGGTETNNGETLTFNSDWSVASRSQSVDAEDALTDTSGLPDALVAQSGDTYASTENFTWGSETTYYDLTGTVLGYSNVNTWSYDDNGTTVSGTNTNYNDAEWNHLGSSWSDAYGSGSMIMSTGTDTGGTLTGFDGIAYRKEVNTFTDADGETSTSTYYFNNDKW